MVTEYTMTHYLEEEMSSTVGVDSIAHVTIVFLVGIATPSHLNNELRVVGCGVSLVQHSQATILGVELELR